MNRRCWYGWRRHGNAANQMGYSRLKLDQDLDGSSRIDCLADYP